MRMIASPQKLRLLLLFALSLGLLALFQFSWMTGPETEPVVAQAKIAPAEPADRTPQPDAPLVYLALSALLSGEVVSGQLEPSAMVHYLVQGNAGQRLTLSLDSWPGQAYFSVYGVQDRRPYKPLATQATRWSAILPSDQDYLVSVATDAEEAGFVLSLEATPPSFLAQLDPTPIRIPPTRNAAVVTSRINGHTQHRYQLDAAAGETINFELKSADPATAFSIVGIADGRTYKWLYDDARSWSFVAPNTQGYLVTVAATQHVDDYALTVTLP